MDDLATGADDGTDHILRDIEGLDARHELLVVGTRLGDGLGHLVEDVEAALTGLLQGFGQHLVGEAVDLDVHLAGGDAIAGTRDLEVHVTKVVLVAEDVGEDGIFAGLAITDHTHGHASDGLAHRHASVHQGEAATAHRGHRGGTVGFEDVAHDTDGVRHGLVMRHHRLEGALGEVAVTDLAAAGAALRLGLASGKAGEVVVQREILGAFHHSTVEGLLVEFGAEGDGHEGLCLTTGEHS